MLPPWIGLPAPRPFVYIDYNYELSYFVDFEGGIEVFDTLEEAYGAVDNYNFEISPAALEAAGGNDDDGLITIPASNGYSRLLIRLNDIERWDMVQWEYHQAVQNIRDWRDNPTLDNACYMLDTHPAFWTRHKYEPTWDWKADGHVKEFWFARGDDCWMMEAGGHTEDFVHKFHDLRLDIWEDTFEDCIIKMAVLVDKFFNEDGTEREGVAYEKSELELLLEERLKELE